MNRQACTNKPPFAPLDFAPARMQVERRANSELVLTSPVPLGPYAPTLGEMLRHWAEQAPERLFLAERPAADAPWREVSYGEAATQALAIGEALLARGLGPQAPVMVLSGNSIDHALLMLGCLLAGVPIVPVSPAYALMSGDFAKLRHIAGLIAPGLIYVQALPPFAAALRAIAGADVELVSSAPVPAGMVATSFATLLATPPGAAIATRAESIDADTVAKILFTSGSTGLPKGVINTHGMLTANQQMVAQCWPFLANMPPLLLDWLPWNHTFGGNHNFNMVLRQGGTLYIDGGKPAPGLIELTIANLREVSPNIYFNVPAGYAMLLSYLERDRDLAQRFFSKLKLIFYAGAALPQDLWQRLEALSVAVLGHRVPMTSAWGSTETAPLAVSAHLPLERAGIIGLPVPGVTIRLVPVGSKYEMRVKGPNVTPGYWRRPDLTAEAFDAEGFYKIGDAGRLADADDPAQGIVFDGRIAEDFKLDTGTWVHVGAVRLAALTAAAPVLQDAVVCGHDRATVGILAWLNLAACGTVCRHAEHHGAAAALATCPDVVARVRAGIAGHNRANSASSTRIARVILMAEPPSIDANEITDKGYINQRATLDRRAALVAQLYAEPPAAGVIVIEDGALPS